MDDHHRMRDTLLEAAVVGTSATAMVAFIATALALLTGEFVGTRIYLLAHALVSALFAFALGMLLSRHRAPEKR
jgi:hypothetical protein